jgi:WD40 repeat protein
MTTRRLAVFVSSPGDVGQERVLAGQVLKRLQGEFTGWLEIRPIFWEHEPLRATADFQGQIPLPSQTDIVVCILWARLGTRLPESYRPEPGAPPPTGTEWEFLDAYHAYEKKKVPDLLVYRKTAEPLVSLNDEQRLQERRTQKKALDAFIDCWLRNPDGSFKAAFHPFASPDEFEKLLETHLRKLIRERIEDPVDPGDWKIWPPGKGSPYRGLEAFEAEYAPVFFGRTRAIGAVRDALARQAAAGRAFVLVLGMSGCGKSSLVRAGMLPMLTQPGVIEGVGLTRYCTFRPSDAAGDLLDGLALALLGKEALPELKDLGYGAPQLAKYFREAPHLAVDPLRLGLKRAAEAIALREKLPHPPESRLGLVVDQMEELFTLERVHAEQRQRFVQVLVALARSGFAWVIATLRSDFYARCAELPELVALKEGAGQYDLLPPTLAETGQIIRYPAHAAGLRFEVNPQTGERLDDVLHEAATRDPEVLPLLEFTLDELYQRKTADGLLTLTAYRGLGGLEGALALRAEEIYTGLPKPMRENLPALFRALVTVRHGDEEVVTARRVPEASLTTTAEQRALLDAFVGARLLVTDKADDGQAVVGLAHEALLRHWPRLQDWLAKDREFLRTRARVAAAAARWRQEGKRPDLLLPEGKPLAEAQELLARRRAELEPAVVEYAEESIRHVAQRRRRKRTVTVSVTGAFFAVVSGFGWFSWVQWQAAEHQRGVAVQEKKNADDQKQLALNQKAQAKAAQKRAEERDRAARRNLRVANLNLAWQGWDTRNPARAIQLLDAAAPSPGEDDLRDFEWYALWWLCHSDRWTARGHTEVKSVAFLPDGKTLATAGADALCKFWESDTGNGKHWHRVKSGILSMAVAPGGKLLALGKGDGTVTLLDYPQYSEKNILGKRPQEKATSVAFGSDGKTLTLAVGTSQGTVRLWDINKQQEVGTLDLALYDDIGIVMNEKLVVEYVLPGGAAGRAGNLKPGDEIVGVSGPDGKMVDTNNMKSDEVAALAWGKAGTEVQLKVRPARAGFPKYYKLTRQPRQDRSSLYVKSVAFSPDGKTLATASNDRTARLWNLSTREERTVCVGHTDFVNCVAFSPDGKTLASGSADRVVALWDLTSSKLRGLSRKHARVLGMSVSLSATSVSLSATGAVTSVAFSADGKTLAAGSEDHTVRLWDVATAKERMALGHLGPVSSVAFDADGKRLAAGSKTGVVRLWDIAAQDWHRGVKGHEERVRSVTFSPDGGTLATGSADNLVILWDVARGEKKRVLRGHANYANSVVFSPDGRTLASGSGDKTVIVWDVAKGEKKRVLRGHTGAVTSVAFSPDGKTLASGSEDAAVRLWDVAARQGPNSLQQTPSRILGRKHTEPVQSVAFAPDGKTLAAAHDDGTVRLWDLATKREKHLIKSGRSPIDIVAFSPDGRALITGTKDGTVKVWDPDTGKERANLLGHYNAIEFVTFSRDGRRLATGSRDGTVKLWDGADWQELGTFHERTAEVASGAFSPDGRTLVTGGVGRDPGLLEIGHVRERRPQPP